MDALSGIASTFSPEEKREAKELENKIDEVTRTIIAEKKSLDSNFVRLGQFISRVREKKYWLLGQYKSFGDYISDCEKKVRIGQSQLYVYMTVARNLLPSVSEDALVEMGVTKAGVLSKYVEQSGKSVIPGDIMDAAKNPDTKTAELDAMVNSSLHNVMPDKGVWFSLGGFFCNEDEKKELTDAVELAKSIDPIVPNNIPGWQQLREAHLRLAREFLNSWQSNQSS